MSDTQIVPPNPTQEQKATAGVAAADGFTTPAVQGALKLDLDKFTANTKELTDLFESCYRDLLSFDKKNLSPAMAPTWKTYKDRYRTLLWDSRDLATEIATSAEQFSTAIIPLATSVQNTGSMSAESRQYLNEVVQTLDYYIDSNSTYATKAKTQADGFNALKADVTAFSNDFEKFGKDLEQQNKIKIEELAGKISAAKEQLASVNKAVIAAGVALGLSLLVTAALLFIPGVGWGCVALGVAAIAGSATALGVLESQAKKLRQQIADDSAEKARLEDQNAEILKIRSALQRMKTDRVSKIADGLGMFEEIWNAVNSDCVSIRKYLMDIKGEPGKPAPLPLIMIMYLKNANTLYIGLAKALRDYAVGIVNSGATPP